MTDQCRTLVVDDEENIRRLFLKELGSGGMFIQTAANGAEARELCTAHHFDIVVLDVCLPDMDGLKLLSEIKNTDPDLELIMITGYGTIPDAVEAIRLGAYDYITKPFELERVEFVIEKAFERARLQKENKLFKRQWQESDKNLLVGQSEWINSIRTLINKVAPSEVPVLITGESGTGKDVVARELHNRSSRSNEPLIIKNCGTLQKELARSELFGHCKGAFTGADQHQEGLLELAHRGSMFLDEIGDLPLEVQSAFLRVLENQTYRKVGSKKECQVNIRFLFATNRNLLQEVQEGKFNEALYHRINVVNIHMPKLKERKQDIPLLVEHFLTKLRPERKFSLSDRAMKILMDYDWPGNVRELKNILERSTIISENEVITEQDLPAELISQEQSPIAHTGWMSLREMEQSYIAQVLEQCGNNRSRASEILRISRKTLYRKLQHN